MQETINPADNMDEYGQVIPDDIKFNYDYDGITHRLSLIIDEYNESQIKNIIGDDFFSIHPFDLYLLKKFIEQNNIKNVIELGCGSSSKFIDNMGIHRDTFALECIHYNIDFNNVNIFSEHEAVQKVMKNTDSYILLIDSEHSFTMAETIDKNLLKPLNYNMPLFFHDWFNNDSIVYSEQIYYLSHVIQHYNIEYVSDLPQKNIDELLQKNNIFNKSEPEKPRICSAILSPKTITKNL